jgi:hypothetical protein
VKPVVRPHPVNDKNILTILPPFGIIYRMRNFGLLVALVLVVGIPTVAQNTIHFLAGTAHNEQVADVNPGSATFGLEYERTLSKKWNWDSTFLYSLDRERGTKKGNTWSGLSLAEYYPNSKIFVGAGAQVTRASSSSGATVSVNPTLEAGLDLPYKRVTFEPYVQAGLPDVIQKTRGRNIGGGLNFYVSTTKNSGVHVYSYAFKNYWNTGNGVSTGILVGYYHKF